LNILMFIALITETWFNNKHDTIRYDTIAEFNVNSKAEYTA